MTNMKLSACMLPAVIRFQSVFLIQAHHCRERTPIFHVSKYGLVGLISLIKRLFGGAKLEPITG